MSSAAHEASTTGPAAWRVEPALVVILAGVCAALHVGKLPPAVTALQAALGLTLVQAGFLLSLVQFAGMSAGVAFGALADGLGPRRSMRIGLALLAVASAAGGFADGAAMLMLLRLAEGLGFLLVVLAAPALVRRLVAPARLSLMLGLWGAYMPLATATALALGPWVIEFGGWPAWWWGLGAVTAAMAWWLARAVPVSVDARDAATDPVGLAAAAMPSWPARLRRTLSVPGPWLVALAFAVYSSQWLAVIGFLPTIYAQAGSPGTTAGMLAALAAAANMAGNIGAGRALHAGARPVALLTTGYVTMALAAAVAFAGAGDAGAPPLVRLAAVLVFSGVGGLVPATLFTLAIRAAPGEGMVSATVGWVQQWSAAGQFAGPPLVAWVVGLSGGWHLTWVVTGGLAAAGLALTALIARRLRA